MSPEKKIVVCWSLPIIPIYNNLHEQISLPLALPDGIVVLDKSDLVKVDYDGKLVWRCPHDWGFWGSPVQLDFDRIVCASINNQLHVIDRTGAIALTIELPTSVTTDILVGKQGDLWFGMGVMECVVTRLDPSGNIVYTVSVARDQGLRQPLAWGADSSLWVASDQSLVRLDAFSGEILAWVGGEWGSFGCFSGAVACESGVFVVAALKEQPCAVLRVTNEGKIAAQYPLPQLLRSRLLPDSKGGAWVVGSTVSAWESATNEDRTFIIHLTPDGKPEAIAQAPAREAVEATFDASGLLWVGTYSYEDADDSEIGELTMYDGAAASKPVWIPEPPAGVGAPVLSSNGSSGVVATSTALVAFTVESI